MTSNPEQLLLNFFHAFIAKYGRQPTVLYANTSFKRWMKAHLEKTGVPMIEDRESNPFMKANEFIYCGVKIVCNIPGTDTTFMSME